MPLNLNNVLIEPMKQGLYHPIKGDFPVRYGIQAEIITDELKIELDRAGRLKYVAALACDWPHPLEYLKRTDGNDWVYYSLGEYADHLSLYGEYYLPCPSYTTNRPLGGDPFRRPIVNNVMRAASEVLGKIYERRAEFSGDLRDFVRTLDVNEPQRLAHHAHMLHESIDSTVPVLPPDARHVDYDVVPFIVADGCRYGCKFCCAHDSKTFAPRQRSEMRVQLARLQTWLGRNTGNYQGLFIGLHDALAADEGLLKWAIEQAYCGLGFENTRFLRPHLFLFGSVHSLLSIGDDFLNWLDQTPWTSYINVGFESADNKTLKMLGKPLTRSRVEAGFQRMVEVNTRWHNIEVTANFVLLPEERGADDAMITLIDKYATKRSSRGICYLSPLMVDSKRPRSLRRNFLERIHRLKRLIRIPIYIYLIQRI